MSVALSADGFERFLSLLGSDREAAGEKYEIVRLKLVKYFELRMCAAPEELADQTIDRVARRLAEGEEIKAGEPMRYVYGVARNVFLENRKAEWRSQAMPAVPIAEDVTRAELERNAAEAQLDCFQRCIEQQSPDSRALLLQYYEESGRSRIEKRTALARQMGVPLNALRIRIHRIKSVVQNCMEKCIRNRGI